MDFVQIKQGHVMSSCSPESHFVRSLLLFGGCSTETEFKKCLLDWIQILPVILKKTDAQLCIIHEQG